MRTAAFHIGDPKGAVERACGLGCGRGARGGPPVHRKIIFQVRRVLDLKGKFGKKKKGPEDGSKEGSACFVFLPFLHRWGWAWMRLDRPSV